MNALINNATINLIDEGPRNGQPVLFVHGFPFSHAMWSEQLRVVSQQYRAIAYDVRGHGESLVGDGQYTIEGHVEDLIALIDHLALPPVVIVGLSMGGYIALRALERNPERFRAAVLCDTRSEADNNEGKLRRAAGAVAVKRDGSAVFADGFVKAVFAAHSLAAKPDAVRAIHDVIRSTPPLSIAGTLIALAARTDTTASLEALSLPTLILVGEHDVTTPPAASQAMHERIRGSELFIVPDAAHMSNLENPEFFNEKLLYFLKRVGSLRQ